MFLSNKASKLRVKEAENARRNRQEIIKALADGQITRRDLFKWGLFTAGGAPPLEKSPNPPLPRPAADSSNSTGPPPRPPLGVPAIKPPPPPPRPLAPP